MTPDEALELVTGDTSYACPAAAVELIVSATSGPSEWRDRCRRALAALDMTRPLLPEREPLDELAANVGAVLVGMLRAGDRRERLRISGLLEALCREAARFNEGRAA